MFFFCKKYIKFAQDKIKSFLWKKYYSKGLTMKRWTLTRKKSECVSVFPRSGDVRFFFLPYPSFYSARRHENKACSGKGERFRIIQSEIEGEQRLQFFLIFVYPAKKVHDGFPEDVLGSVKTGVYHLFFWGISITVLWGLSLESREVETTGRSLFPWPTRPTPCSCNIWRC